MLHVNLILARLGENASSASYLWNECSHVMYGRDHRSVVFIYDFSLLSRITFVAE